MMRWSRLGISSAGAATSAVLTFPVATLISMVYIDGLSSLKPNCSMADKPSPAPEDDQHGQGAVEVGDDGTSSRDWLQLGLASPADRSERMPTEIELFSGGPSSSSSPVSSTSTVTYPVAWPGIGGGFRAPMMGTTMTMMPWTTHRRDMPWGPWNNPNLAMGARPTLIPPPVMPEFVARQFMYPISSSASPSVPEIWPHIRVVSPPRRPQSGVWFMLQAAQNQ